MATIRRRKGKWQVQIRHKGVAGLSKSFIHRKDAEAWARQQEVHNDHSSLPLDPRHLGRFTLRDLVIRYRDTVTVHKRASKNEAIVLNAFLRHPICNKRLSDLTQEDFASYRDQRLKEVKAYSLKRMLSPIQNLFEIARTEWGLPIRENPICKLKIVCLNNRRERRLREGELERLVAASTKTKNELILPVIRFALETGLRRSEILSASWSDLNSEMRVLNVPKTKNGHARCIPLSATALAILETRNRTAQGIRVAVSRSNDGLIFPITTNAFRLAWERLRLRAGLQDLNFHDLRHEAISRFFELGLTLPEVAHISGHRDPRMLFRYSHAQNRRILEKLC